MPQTDENEAAHGPFERLLTVTTDWVWEVDAAGVYTYAGTKVQDIMGYPPAEVVGRRPFDFMASAEAERAGAIFQEAAARKAPLWAVEHTLLARDGREVVFETNAVPLFDESGELRGYLGSCRDITNFRREATERRRVETALRESEDRLRATLDSLTTSVALLDETGRIVYVNRAWRLSAEENGCDAEAVGEGVDYLGVCDQASGEHSEEAEAFADAIRQVLSERTNEFVMEYPCHSPDKQRWFEGRVTPLAGDRSRRVVVAHSNITERQVATMALRNAALERQTILDSQPQHVILHSPELAVVWPNRAACESAGMERPAVHPSSGDGDLRTAAASSTDPHPANAPCRAGCVAIYITPEAALELASWAAARREEPRERLDG